MNVEYFSELLNMFILEMPHCFCPTKATLIQHSLIILQTENKFKNIYFWGRIDSLEYSYYIAFGYTNDLLSDRQYFYSQNCIEWFLLDLWNCDKNINFISFDWSVLYGDISAMHYTTMVK